MEACAECTQNCLLIHQKHDPSRTVFSFFKVMFGKCFSELLIVPPRFVKVTYLEAAKTYLEDSIGRKWDVALSYVNGVLAIQEGWNEFVIDHGIEMGDFVIFHYFMNSHFVVQIFGRNGCESLTIGRERSYQNKRAKTTGDATATDNTRMLSDEELTHIESSSACAVSLPGPKDAQRQADTTNMKEMHMLGKRAHSQKSYTDSGKEVTNADMSDDLCFIVKRDSSSVGVNNREHLFDLSTFERVNKNVDTDKSCNLQVQGDGLPQVSGKSQEAATSNSLREGCGTEGGTSHEIGTDQLVTVDVSERHIAERLRVAHSKYDDEFNLSSNEYTPELVCGLVDVSSRSKMLHKRNKIPRISDISDTSGSDKRLRIFNQEANDSRRKSRQNSPRDDINSSTSKEQIVNGDYGFASDNLVTKKGDANVNTKAIVLWDSAPALVKQITCIVKPDNLSYLILPEYLPLKTTKQGSKSDQWVVLLRDPERRLWPVLYHERDDIQVLASGWQSFREANRIQPGDKCVIVAENVYEGTFRVSFER